MCVWIAGEKACCGVSPAPGLSVMSLSSRPLLRLVCAGGKVRLCTHTYSYTHTNQVPYSVPWRVPGLILWCSVFVFGIQNGLMLCEGYELTIMEPLWRNSVLVGLSAFLLLLVNNCKVYSETVQIWYNYSPPVIWSQMGRKDGSFFTAGIIMCRALGINFKGYSILISSPIIAAGMIWGKLVHGVSGFGLLNERLRVQIL